MVTAGSHPLKTVRICLLALTLPVGSAPADVPYEIPFLDEDFSSVIEAAAVRGGMPQMMTRALTPALAAMAEQVDQVTDQADRYRREGAFEKAEASLAHFPPEKASDLDDFSRMALAGANLNLGTSYQRIDRYRNAATAFSRAARFDTSDYRSEYSLGTAYRKLEHYDQAIAALNRSIALNPDFASSYFSIGSVYFNQGKADLARTAYSAAAEKDPNHVAAQFMLGSVAWNEQDYEAAASAWRRVLEINPNHSKAKEWLDKAVAMVR
jgi:tetratricopeptide (TPR) repeat protein